MQGDTSSLEEQFLDACTQVGVKEADRNDIIAILEPLRRKHPPSYHHSLRVALRARAIACHQHFDERALLFAGALHDIGKALVPLRVLEKTDEWTALDQRIMQRHVLDGYRLLRDRFDFSGEVMLWHHRFQVRGYPKRLPPPLHRYSTATRVLIMEYGRLLALADVYDALHRSNSRSKHGGLSAEEIKEKMLEYNPDRRPLIHALYASGVLE